MTYFDPIAALVQLLKDNSALATEVTRSSRVWIVAGQMPGNFDGGKAVFIPGDGGEMHTTYTQMNAQIRCYGAEYWDAMSVWLKLMNALHDQGPIEVTVTGGKAVMGKAMMLSGPVPDIEPEKEWKFVNSLWDIIWYGRVVS